MVQIGTFLHDLALYRVIRGKMCPDFFKSLRHKIHAKETVTKFRTGRLLGYWPWKKIGKIILKDVEKPLYERYACKKKVSCLNFYVIFSENLALTQAPIETNLLAPLISQLLNKSIFIDISHNIIIGTKSSK